MVNIKLIILEPLALLLLLFVLDNLQQNILSDPWVHSDPSDPSVQFDLSVLSDLSVHSDPSVPSVQSDPSVLEILWALPVL